MTADIAIRLLSDGDLDAALTLSGSCGWNQRAADWAMLRRMAPAGTFGAIAAGRVVGTAIGLDYQRFGWIAMMLVDPAFRGRGVGARLLEAAMGAIPPGRPIRLDATPLGRPLYERYGFELESSLSRHVRAAGVQSTPSPRAAVRVMIESDLPAVMATDRQVSGTDRRAAIHWVFGDSRRYAWIDDDGAGGYCLGRGGRLFDHIGPIVASTADSAAALASAAIGAGSGCSVVIDAYDANDGFVAWLRSVQFEAQRPLYRMCRRGVAPLPARPDLPVEFAILGPEFS